MNTQSAKSACARLGSCLRTLREEAQKAHGHISLGKLQIALGKGEELGARGELKWKVSISTISSWLKGEIAPSEKKLSTYWALINYLEERTPRPGLRRAEWEQLIAEARAEAQRNPGGRPPGSSSPARAAPFRYCHIAGGHLPPVLAGREADLAQLQELIRSGSGYLALVAPPWAGKTAFLATFITNHLTDDIDLVAYFVRRRQESDNAGNFLRTMVTQLGLHVGKKRPGRADRATLLALYGEAARTSLGRGRSLLLVIDGLDEDTGACVDGQSIASLLPQQPYPGLRVLISRRWHPPLPGDVPLDHPLRKAEQITGFRPSPQAGVLRSTALNDLASLFRDPRGWVREVIGYLVLATGGLSRDNLIELIRRGGHVPTPIQFDLTDLLHNVAGRGIGLADLEPDTLVMAHEELYGAATDELGPETLAELTQRLHSWADHYRDDGWPASTPGYLLHHYQELLRSAGDPDRCTAFALDHRRLLRLATQGRTDLALASLDQVTQTTPTPGALASAAASRSLLGGENPVVPREVLRALVVVGDVERARSLALSPADPASKAVRLMEVVQALLPLETSKAEGQAARLAREAAKWAERAQQQKQLAAPTAELDIEAIVPRAAVVLAAAGLPDAAIRLLRQIDICLPANAVRAAEAAALSLESSPTFAARLLDELMLEAESQAESAEGKPVLAVEIWSAVATADPGRAELIHRRMKAFSEELTVQTSGLTAVDCCALTASALAAALPDEARKLAKKARREAWKVLGIAPKDGLRESLARAVQALLDVGESPKEVRSLLASAPVEITSRAALLLDGSPNEEDIGPESIEAKRAEELLRSMKSLSGLGDGPQLRQALNLFMKNTSGQSAPITWLPFLSEALASADEGTRENRALLESSAPDTSLVIRGLTSAALAHADAQRHGKALHYAERAAEIAQPMTATQPPEVRALVAQAFAHAGDAERAREWAAPPPGRKPSGRTGIPYRRAALAIEMGLNPKAVVARTITDGLPGSGINTSGSDLLTVLRSHAVGTRTDAQVASLETTASARLDTEPLIATGLALLRAVFGDTEHAYGTLAELPDPADRGVAQATVAVYLAGVPVHLDVAGGEDCWTLSVLRVLSHHMYPKAPDTTLQNLTYETLKTSSWYRILPVLSRTDPEALYRVVDVLDQHRQAKGTES